MLRAPIACDLSVFSADERSAHIALSRRVLSSIRELHELADGFAFRFEASSELQQALAQWIEGERRCCPFFRFEVERTPSGELQLCVTGPGAAKEILRAGLSEHHGQ